MENSLLHVAIFDKIPCTIVHTCTFTLVLLILVFTSATYYYYLKYSVGDWLLAASHQAVLL